MDSPNPFDSSPSQPPQDEDDVDETNNGRIVEEGDDLDTLQEHEYLENSLPSIHRPIASSETSQDEPESSQGQEERVDEADKESEKPKTFELSSIGRQPSVPADDEDTSEPIYSPTTQELPHVNCPEKIILCIDLSEEVNRVPFFSRDGTKMMPLEIVKRALILYIRTKLEMNPRHQFALVIFQESFVWFQDFTSHADNFLHVIHDLTADGREPDSCNLTSLFTTLDENIGELPDSENKTLIPPPFIVRTMFIYGRSSVIPTFENGNGAQQRLAQSPYFFFDVFYLHEPPSELNSCKEIFDAFLALDKEGKSYIHEVGRNTTHVYDKFAMLLAHPLQRQLQEISHYSIFPKP